jgi:hypothetical protein
MLVDDILLEIFDFYRMSHYDILFWLPHPAWNWCILAHVCQRWRKVMFESPHCLNLRILCTYRTPVRKNLSIWPALPIDLELSFRRLLKPQDEDNIITALEHRDRVYSVRLYTTGSQLAKLAAVMQEPFPVLTHLQMRLRDENTPVLTTKFFGGSAPHLQEITLYRIPFPALPTLLLSTSDLVTLKLFKIPTSGYISPERMVACLAALPRLKTFTIRFRQFSFRPDRIHPPPVTRPVLSALTDFEFRGDFVYVEVLVAQIDSPKLERVYITYLDPPDDFQVTHLSEFIDRSIGLELTLSRHALVHFSSDEVAFILSCKYPNYPGWEQCSVETNISCEVFEWKLPDMARALIRFSAALCTVVHLELDAHLIWDGQSEDAYDIEWLDLFCQFPAMQTLHVSTALAPPVFLVLEDITAELVAEALPSLGLICVEGETASSLEKIVAIRQFSGRPITVVKTRDEFNERLESYVSR